MLPFPRKILQFLEWTTDMNLGQAHCPASRAPTLDLWIASTKFKKFVIQGFNMNYENLISNSFLTEKQMRAVVRKGFAHHSVKLTLLAKSSRWDWFQKVFPAMKSSIRLNHFPISTPNLLTHIRIYGLWSKKAPEYRFDSCFLHIFQFCG